MVQFIIKVMPRKGSLYDKSKQVNDEFPNYPTKILLEVLNKKPCMCIRESTLTTYLYGS